MAHFAIDDLQARTAAVLYDVASAYNKDIAEIFKAAFEGAGGRVVAFETYTTDNRDFSGSLAAVRARNPDVLLLPNYVDEVPLQVEQARRMGIAATFLGSDSWSEDIFPRLPHFDGSFYIDNWHSDIASTQAQAFLDTYRQNAGREPTEIAALTYDAFGLLFEAIRRQNTLDGALIREGLARTEDYPGITGTISYRGTGDPVKGAVIVQIKDGNARFYQSVQPTAGPRSDGER